MDNQSQAPRSLIEWGFLAALVVLFVALGVRTTFKVLDDRSAFRRWQPQIQKLGDVDLSREFNYPNPPIMAVLLEPLAALPPVAGALVWFALKSLMAVIALVWVFRLVESEGAPFLLWAKGLTVLLSLKPIVDDLSHGNVNLFIAFLVIACLTAFRARRDFLAGGLLALAIACKVTPALFIPYFLWKRQWRVLAGCAVGLILFLYPGVVPALRLGWQDNHQQLISWYDGMVKPFLIDGKVTSEHINQSLPGLAFRLLSDNPSFVLWQGDIETPARFHNVLSLTAEQVKWLLKGGMVAFALAVVWACRAPVTPRHGWRLAAEFALVSLGMLLFSERTWKHHCVTLMLPFAVACYALAYARPQSWPWRSLAGALAVTAALLLITGMSSGKDRAESAASPGLAKLALVYGSYTWACLILLAVMLGLLRSARASSALPGVSTTEPAARAA